MPPMMGQRTISAFATKRHGIAALIEKMSIQETWFESSSRPLLPGVMPVLTSSSLSGWPLTRRRTPQRRSTQRDHQ